MPEKIINCAIYTRKSTEEGLEQGFNSLDNQYEFCTNYLKSLNDPALQLLPARYDDGGYSGGSLNRPALQRLLADIQCGLVNRVIIYKIDRLTREIRDFFKLLDIFEKYNVEFVSVKENQYYNTTTAIGRLMVNMFLVFAQFERENAGDRIRDKIATSKAKGMWMGGCPPYGYDIGDRCLVINETEAQNVRFIYQTFAIPILWQIRQMPSIPAASVPNAIPPGKGGLSAAASFRSKPSSAFYKIRCIKAWLPTAANNIPVSMPPLSTRYSLTWFRLFLPPTRRNVKPDALKCRLPAVNEKPRP